MSNQTSPLDHLRPKITEWVQEGKSYQAIADFINQFYHINTTRHSVRRAIKRWGIKKLEGVENPSFTLDGDDAKIVSRVHAVHDLDSEKLNTPENLLRERGLDPDEWEITHMKVNEWDAMTSDKAEGDNRIVTMKQLTVNLKRRVPLDLVVPARMPGNYIRELPKARSQYDDEVRTVVFVGDQQAPKHDKRLHDLFLEWMDYNRPDEGIMMGDAGDFSRLSKYADNPEWDEEVQECIDSVYMIKRETVQASPTTTWTMIEGNHDTRLRTMVLNKLPAIYGLCKAKVPGKLPDLPVLSIPSLLRLDELGIEYATPKGDYEHAQVKITKNLAARHGWIVRKGAGASALATLEHLGHSIVIGHVHRQSIVHKTVHDIDGNPGTIAAMETGCMCTADGLGYAVNPDWQQGFGTATIWPDGFFKLELATYVNNTLLYREQRYH